MGRRGNRIVRADKSHIDDMHIHVATIHIYIYSRYISITHIYM